MAQTLRRLRPSCPASDDDSDDEELLLQTCSATSSEDALRRAKELAKHASPSALEIEHFMNEVDPAQFPVAPVEDGRAPSRASSCASEAGVDDDDDDVADGDDVLSAEATRDAFEHVPKRRKRERPLAKILRPEGEYLLSGKHREVHFMDPLSEEAQRLFADFRHEHEPECMQFSQFVRPWLPVHGDLVPLAQELFIDYDAVGTFDAMLEICRSAMDMFAMQEQVDYEEFVDALWDRLPAVLGPVDEVLTKVVRTVTKHCCVLLTHMYQYAEKKGETLVIELNQWQQARGLNGVVEAVFYTELWPEDGSVPQYLPKCAQSPWNQLHDELWPKVTAVETSGALFRDIVTEHAHLYLYHAPNIVRLLDAVEAESRKPNANAPVILKQARDQLRAILEFGAICYMGDTIDSAFPNTELVAWARMVNTPSLKCLHFGGNMGSRKTETAMRFICATIQAHTGQRSSVVVVWVNVMNWLNHKMKVYATEYLHKHHPHLTVGVYTSAELAYNNMLHKNQQEGDEGGEGQHRQGKNVIGEQLTSSTPMLLIVTAHYLPTLVRMLQSTLPRRPVATVGVTVIDEMTRVATTFGAFSAIRQCTSFLRSVSRLFSPQFIPPGEGLAMEHKFKAVLLMCAFDGQVGTRPLPITGAFVQMIMQARRDLGCSYAHVAATATTPSSGYQKNLQVGFWPLVNGGEYDIKLLTGTLALMAALREGRMPDSLWLSDYLAFTSHGTGRQIASAVGLVLADIFTEEGEPKAEDGCFQPLSTIVTTAMSPHNQNPKKPMSHGNVLSCAVGMNEFVHPMPLGVPLAEDEANQDDNPAALPNILRGKVSICTAAVGIGATRPNHQAFAAEARDTHLEVAECMRQGAEWCRTTLGLGPVQSEVYTTAERLFREREAVPKPRPPWLGSESFSNGLTSVDLTVGGLNTEAAAQSLARNRAATKLLVFGNERVPLPPEQPQERMQKRSDGLKPHHTLAHMVGNNVEATDLGHRQRRVLATAAVDDSLAAAAKERLGQLDRTDVFKSEAEGGMPADAYFDVKQKHLTPLQRVQRLFAIHGARNRCTTDTFMDVIERYTSGVVTVFRNVDDALRWAATSLCPPGTSLEHLRRCRELMAAALRVLERNPTHDIRVVQPRASTVYSPANVVESMKGVQRRTMREFPHALLTPTTKTAIAAYFANGEDDTSTFSTALSGMLSREAMDAQQGSVLDLLVAQRYPQAEPDVRHRLMQLFLRFKTAGPARLMVEGQVNEGDPYTALVRAVVGYINVRCLAEMDLETMIMPSPEVVFPALVLEEEQNPGDATLQIVCKHEDDEGLLVTTKKPPCTWLQHMLTEKLTAVRAMNGKTAELQPTAVRSHIAKLCMDMNTLPVALRPVYKGHGVFVAAQLTPLLGQTPADYMRWVILTRDTEIEKERRLKWEKEQRQQRQQRGGQRAVYEGNAPISDEERAWNGGALTHCGTVMNAWEKSATKDDWEMFPFLCLNGTVSLADEGFQEGSVNRDTSLEVLMQQLALGRHVKLAHVAQGVLKAFAPIGPPVAPAQQQQLFLPLEPPGQEQEHSLVPVPDGHAPYESSDEEEAEDAEDDDDDEGAHSDYSVEQRRRKHEQLLAEDEDEDEDNDDDNQLPVVCSNALDSEKVVHVAQPLIRKFDSC